MSKQPAPPVPSSPPRLDVPAVLPVLPLRDTVVFPGTVAPLSVSRTSSLKLLDESLPHSKIIAVVAQRDIATDNPKREDLYDTGCAAVVLRMIRQEDRAATLLVQGLARIA